MQRSPGKLDAVLEVEPQHVYDLQGRVSDSDHQGNPAVPCPVEVLLTWDSAKAFALAGHEPSCPPLTKPRGLKIADDGSISTTTPEIRNNN